MVKLYLIISTERMSDEYTTVYWKPGGNGYTTKIKKAGRFTIEQAEQICNAPNVTDHFILDEED